MLAPDKFVATLPAVVVVVVTHVLSVLSPICSSWGIQEVRRYPAVGEARGMHWEMGYHGVPTESLR